MKPEAKLGCAIGVLLLGTCMSAFMFYIAWLGAAPENGEPNVAISIVVTLVGVGVLTVSCLISWLAFRSARKSERSDGAIDLVLVDEENVPDVAWWRGYRMVNATNQKGAIVARPNYVAFLPLQAAENIFGNAAKNVAGTATGIQSISLNMFGAEPDWEKYLSDVWQYDPAIFDQTISDVIQSSGGFRWESSQSTVWLGRGLTKNNQGISFQCGQHELHSLAPRHPAIDRTLADWKRSASAPNAANVKRLFGIAIICTIIGAYVTANWYSGEMPFLLALFWDGLALLLWSMIVVNRVRR